MEIKDVIARLEKAIEELKERQMGVSINYYEINISNDFCNTYTNWEGERNE